MNEKYEYISYLNDIEDMRTLCICQLIVQFLKMTLSYFAKNKCLLIFLSEIDHIKIPEHVKYVS